MASRRNRFGSRRLDLRGPSGPRSFRPSAVSGSTVGRSPWRSRLVQSLLRPGAVAVSLEAQARRTQRPLEALRARRARIAPNSTFVVLSRPRQAVRLAWRFPPIAKPVLRSEDSVCRSREKRREVMFASGVAGKSWKRGGPRMRGAVFSNSSFYKCGG